RQVLEENRELRVVAIPDSTSGDLRMRVGEGRFWNALELIGEGPLAGPAVNQGAAAAPAHGGDAATAADDAPSNNGHSGTDAAEDHDAARSRAAIVGHIPVTWRTADGVPHGHAVQERLLQCIELVLRAQ